MSLFKTRDIWTTVVGENENFDIGCVCLADVDDSGQNKIVVGSYSGYLRVYNPSVFIEDNDAECRMKPEDLMCEVVLSDPILQIQAGRFVSGSEKLAILVLHSKKFTTYFFTTEQGAGDSFSQCHMVVAYEHKLKRNAFNLCFGTFGGVKGRDHVCVQSMDGVLSVFEQEVFAFSRFLPNSLIPGPIGYVSSIDCFVTASSCRQVECYKLQTLALASDVSSSDEDAGKKIIAEWTFAIDDNAKDISINKSNLPPNIFVLGERNLYSFSDQGHLVFMMKFDFEPSSFCVYSATDTSVKTNILLTTHSRTLLIYGDTTLQWAAQLNNIPVQIMRANFGKYRGLIMTLDDEGHLNCSYLGTNPTIFNHKVVSDEREIDFVGAQQELKQLQAVINDKKNLTGQSIALKSSKNSSSEVLKMSLILKHFKEIDTSVDSEVDEAGGLPSVMLNIMLQSRINLVNVRVSITCGSSFSITTPSFVVQNIDSGRTFEKSVKVYKMYRDMETSLDIHVVVVYHTQQGISNFIEQSLRLPLLLIVKSCEPEKNAAHKLTIDSNHPTVHLKKLFPHCFTDDETTQNSGSVVSFRHLGTQHSVSLLASKSSSRYRIQCDHLPSAWLIVDEFVDRLKKHSTDVRLDFNKQELPYDGLFDFIDKHFKMRKDRMELNKLLEEASIQLRVIQKKLLIICKDKTPASFSNVDLLLEMTHRRIISLADRIETKNDELVTSSSDLCNVINLFIRFLEISCSLNGHEVHLLVAALVPDVQLADASIGWEEIVECNVAHLLRTSLSNNVKDNQSSINQSSISQSTHSLEDVHKLKKYLRTFCEKICNGGRLSSHQSEHDAKSDAMNETSKDRKTSLKNKERNLDSPDVSAGFFKKHAKPHLQRRILESLNEEPAEVYDDDNDDDHHGDNHGDVSHHGEDVDNDDD